MGNKRASLGRGLDKLLNNTSLLEEPAKPGDVTPGLLEIPLDRIQAGKYQPRKDMDVGALEQLASSIRKQGVLQPIVVRSISANRYEIVAGERRWRAAQMVGLKKIPSIIKELSDQITMAVALIENIQRENLNPMDEAVAIQRLIDECAMTHQQIAESLSKSRASVSNLLRLMSLTAEVREFIQRGELDLGHAKVLLALDSTEQAQAARMVTAKKLSVRETEKLVKNMQSPARQLYPDKMADPDLLRLQNNLSEKLKAQVKINHNQKGKGKMVIHYQNLEELDNIITLMN